MQVYISTKRSGEDCVESIKTINNLIQTQYLANNLTIVTDIFNATQVFQNETDQVTVLAYISDIIAGMVQYGKRVELCRAISSVNGPWDKLKELSIVGNMYGFANPDDYAVESLQNLTWSPSGNIRQWSWQYCQQFGWFQTDSEKNMRSPFINVTFYQWSCNQIFSYPGGLNLPDTDVTAAQLSYLGSQIIYTNGNEDPWQWASIDVKGTEDRPTLTINCDFCGHCIDLKTPGPNDPYELTKARSYIKYYLKKWLNN